jgi:hypothetical protein
MALALGFCVLAAGLGAIAVAAATAGTWPVAIGSGGLAGWFLSSALGAFRRARRVH